MTRTRRYEPEPQVLAHSSGGGVRVEGREYEVELPAGRFRYLEWPGTEPTVVLLHGLSGVADVWHPLVSRLQAPCPRILAFDQRGHGRSHPGERRYDIGAYVEDALSFMQRLRLDRPHLAGHSMGARVAMVLAARHPEAICSVAMVDIGPEAWKANWQSTVDAFDKMPAEFAGEAEATTYASRGREMSEEAKTVFLSRLEETSEGRLRWRADTAALAEAVRSQRSRNFWRDWERIRPPALLVRGAESRELRRPVFEQMQRRNPTVSYEEIADVGHNIPLIAPGELAMVLRGFWEQAGER